MHYVGYSSAFIRDVEACDITVWLCLDHQDLLQHRGAARAPSPDPNPSHQALHDRPQTTPQMYETPESRLNQLDDMEPVLFVMKPKKRRFFGLKRALFICKLPHCAGDRELIQEVLFDAVVTAPLEAYWTGLALNKSE